MKNMTRTDITIRKEDEYLVIEDSINILSNIRHRINKNNSGEIIRTIAEKNRTGEKTCFYLNKQSALNNNFNVIDENMSPLGDIKVEIYSSNIEESISWITNQEE